MKNVSDSSNNHFTRSKKINKEQIQMFSSLENKNSKKFAHKFLEEAYHSIIKFTKKRNKSKRIPVPKRIYSPIPFPKKSKSNKNVKEKKNENKQEKEISNNKEPIKENKSKKNKKSKNKSDLNSKSKNKIINDDEDEENYENGFNLIINKNEEIQKLLIAYNKNKSSGKNIKEEENNENIINTNVNELIKEETKNSDVKDELNNGKNNKSNNNMEIEEKINDNNLQNNNNILIIPKNSEIQKLLDKHFKKIKSRKIKKDKNKNESNISNEDKNINNIKSINNVKNNNINDLQSNNKTNADINNDNTIKEPEKKNIFGIFHNTIEFPATTNNNNNKNINQNTQTQNNKSLFTDLDLKKSQVNSIQINACLTTIIKPDIYPIDFKFNFENKFKKKFFAKIEEITPDNLLGNKKYRCNSGPQIKFRKKRRKKIIKQKQRDQYSNYDIEVTNTVSNSLLKTSQNTVKEQTQPTFTTSDLNLITDDDYNMTKITKKNKINKKKNKHKKEHDTYCIRIKEENNDEGNFGLKISNNDEGYENIEIISFPSTQNNQHNLPNETIYQYRDLKNSNDKTEEFIELDLSNQKRKNSDDSNNSEKSSGEFFSDIKLIPDENYFSFDTQYIKYNPIQSFNKFKDNIENKNKNKEFLNIPPIYQIPRINPELDDLFPKITEKLEKFGMIIYNKEEREEDLYKGSFPLVDDKLRAEVMVPCYDDEQVFAEKKEKFPKMAKFDEDNDIQTDEEQLQMEIKRGNESLIKFLEEEKKNKNYLADKLSRNDIVRVEDSKEKEKKKKKENKNGNNNEMEESEDGDYNIDSEAIEEDDNFECEEEDGEEENEDDDDNNKMIIEK